MARNDNTTPMVAKEYDKKINDVIPYYPDFYMQTIDVVEQCEFAKMDWLDLGCGTKYFPLTMEQHIQLLKSVGFRKVHVFWISYMQMGIYAMK